MLSDFGIKKARKKRRLVIEPFDQACLGANSYDLQTERIYIVGNTKKFKYLLARNIQINSNLIERFIREECEPYDGLLLPRKRYVAVTTEKVRSSNYLELTMRSSLARNGIEMHPINKDELMCNESYVYSACRTFGTKCSVPLGTRFMQLSVDPRSPLKECEIKKMLARKEIEIDGHGQEVNLFPDGALLRLGSKIRRYNGRLIEIAPGKDDKDCFELIDISDASYKLTGYEMESGRFYLGETYEWLRFPDTHAGMLRQLDEEWLTGDIHPNAPLVSAGSSGNQVFEFYFPKGYKVWEWKPICKIQILPLDRKPEKPYGSYGRYSGQRDVQTSLSHRGL